MKLYKFEIVFGLFVLACFVMAMYGITGAEFMSTIFGSLFAFGYLLGGIFLLNESEFDDAFRRPFKKIILSRRILLSFLFSVFMLVLVFGNLFVATNLSGASFLWGLGGLLMVVIALIAFLLNIKVKKKYLRSILIRSLIYTSTSVVLFIISFI